MAADLRIGVNLCWLVPGVVGGSEESTLRTLRAMADADPAIELVLFGLPALAAAHPDLVRRFDLRTVPVSGRAKALRVAAEHAWLGRTARETAVDLLHHAGGTAPGRFAGPTLLTIHDLQPLDFPQHFSRTKVEWLRRTIPQSIETATRVAVPSQFVADSITARFSTDPARIDVVPHGIDLAPAAESEDSGAAEWAGIDLPNRFLLLPAITYPHKGHLVAIEALGLLPDDVGLVLPGGEGPAESDVRRAIEASPARARIHRIGRVPISQLDWLFRHASALVWPSTYEGFGLPVIEAMAAGTPVVAVRAGASPEIVGDAGVLVGPGDAGAIAAAAAEILDNQAHRDGLIRRGRRRAARFSTVASARRLSAAYRSAVAAQ